MGGGPAGEECEQGGARHVDHGHAPPLRDVEAFCQPSGGSELILDLRRWDDLRAQPIVVQRHGRGSHEEAGSREPIADAERGVDDVSGSVRATLEGTRD